MDRQQSATFLTNSGGEQSVRLQNLSENTEVLFWNKVSDEAIDGTLRSNIKGARKTYQLRWEINTEPAVIEALLNDIIADVDAGAEFFYFGIDSDNVRRVVLDDDNANKIRYNNQHGRYSPVLNLIAKNVSGVVLRVIDYRFITEDVTEYIDYGLITEAVTEQKDYEFISL